ncbi:hypothetical protein BDQ12DRAFT_639416 [Crucibulum laeve]|uniref:Uncharacterized protein n=1 Tax=Crucibulum laeve TaxID=68775 RepID=A0A5C3LFQ2_9AGAR|nr:hypothetical protein BDQ12DRAFT_639416 [Crucibulum laeve]
MPALLQVVADELLMPRGLNITSFVPHRGDTLMEEMKCYSLPYGGLGFASHVLTYYAIICLWARRSPIWPFRRVNCSKLDLSLGIVGLALSVGLSIFAIVMCKNTWQLLVIAVWKMSMSMLNGITAVHAAVVVMNGGKSTGEAAWWIVLYLPGMFAGMSGLMSLVVKHWYDAGVRKITIAFYSIVGIGAVIVFIGIYRGLTSKPKYEPVTGEKKKDEERVWYWGIGGLAFSVSLFTVLAAFYGDWTLGMMTNNLVGLPSGDNSGLYWSYFVAKRLTMFSL